MNNRKGSWRVKAVICVVWGLCKVFICLSRRTPVKQAKLMYLYVATYLYLLVVSIKSLHYHETMATKLQRLPCLRLSQPARPAPSPSKLGRPALVQIEVGKPKKGIQK